MSQRKETRMSDNKPSISLNRRTLFGAVVIGGVGLASIGGFLFAENIVGPWRLTARRLVDRLQETDGHFLGFRRNHAKGVAVWGRFDSNGNGAALSRASVFQPGTYRLSGRFSLAGGNPHAGDVADTRRGLGLQLFLPAGEQWRMAMINIPVFLDATPQDFYERTLAFANDRATGKPDPQRIEKYLADHPKTAAALAIIHATPPAASFGRSTFYGLNAFEFTDNHDRTTPVRWMLVPEATGPGPAGGRGRNGLFDDLVTDIRRAPLRWKLVVVTGIRGQDPTHDPTTPWPEDRRRVEVGTVVLTDVATETSDNVRDVNFDPLVLPDGITASDDPVLQARSAVYAESFRRRASETRAPGAIRVEDVE